MPRLLSQSNQQTDIQTTSYEKNVSRKILSGEHQALESSFEIVKAEVTGYSSEESQTDSTPFITASGATVRTGTVACPVRFLFGTRIGIDGVIYTCDDRMAKRYQATNHFDVWFQTSEEAIKFGRQKKEVIIYEKQP